MNDNNNSLVGGSLLGLLTISTYFYITQELNPSQGTYYLKAHSEDHNNTSIKATKRGKLLCLGPQVVALRMLFTVFRGVVL